ncbi:HlyD family secretion protein [Candidatus Kuenenia stuttgartiensis]|uniref:HlyD family secretion protein n=1 Tax=Kuenenia stuttgartiensis TaxID=174633 RepID=UPI00146CD0BA|nr:efflux RND transporter periplasmic adaptor subunit [Candidatus Kuenenia stuttgartiensis]
MAKTRLGYTTIKSSISGIVLSKNVEPGEYVSPGTPVVIMCNLNDIWLRAYINETDLGRIKVGQKVHITTDTYPEKIYEGHVSFIASEAEFTSQERPNKRRTGKTRLSHLK